MADDPGHPATDLAPPWGSEAIEDLLSRWEGARRAALREVLADRPALEEAELVREAHARDRERALRRVFDNSRLVGIGFRRVVRGGVPPGAVPGLLAALRDPCLSGTWSSERGARSLVLERPGCEDACAAVCDHRREAADGLLIGLSDDLRLSRHRSRGHGDTTCRDLVHDGPPRFGAVPDELRDDLASIARRAGSLGAAEVRFVGLSEGTLLYEVRRNGCAGIRIEPLVESQIHNRFPGLSAREVSPRPVIAAT